MTAEQHLAEAERLLSEVMTSKWDTAPVAHATIVNVAIAHGLAAVAIELGVPHASADSYGAGHGT